MNVLSLCSGTGSIELGLRLAVGPSARAICYVERSLYLATCLSTRMGEGNLHPAPIHSDLTTFDARPWLGAVDCVTAGAPCQPFSSASRGRKVALDLLPHVARVVGECRSPFVFVENVEGSEEGLERFARALLEFDYEVPEPIRVAASYLGAPHNRKRLWLLAYSHSEGKSMLPLYEEVALVRGAPRYVPWREAPSDSILRVHDGDAYRMDRARACGNGVMPAMAAAAWNALIRKAAQHEG